MSEKKMRALTLTSRAAFSGPLLYTGWRTLQHRAGVFRAQHLAVSIAGTFQARIFLECDVAVQAEFLTIDGAS